MKTKIERKFKGTTKELIDKLTDYLHDHVANYREETRDKYYDGSIFTRALAHTMAKKFVNENFKKENENEI